jgi:hypothetical protein
MKRLNKWALIVACLIFCIHAVSAFGVSSVVIDPSGSLVPNTPVKITYKIEFTASGDETFPSDSELQMSTDLENAKWNYSLVLDGADIPQPSNSGRVLGISGWILSYSSTMQEALKVTVEGTSPSVAKTGNKTLFKICEYDSNNNVVSCVERTTVIVNGCCIESPIVRAEEHLQTYRSHIDEKSALGIDTAAAEAKYSEAEQKIKSAKTRPSTHYLQTFADIDAARAAIDDGEIALDRSWAEKAVADAQVPIKNVDSVIAWFKGNASTRDDAQLPAIITKREIALSYLESARDEINKGNFEQARAKAEDAYNKGNESYNDACRRSKLPGCGNNPPPKPGTLIIRLSPIEGTIIILLIAGILCVAGFFWWRRRKRSWLE